MPGPRRAVRVAAAAAAALMSGLAPTAHADAAPSCPNEGSVVLAEFDTQRQHTRVVAYPASATETDVCVQTLTTVQVVLVAHGDVAAISPAVSQSAPDEDSGCTSTIIGIDDPQRLTLMTGANTGSQSFCLGADAGTTALTFAATGPAAAVDVWLPAHSFLNEWGYCSRYYARWKGGHGPSQGAWESCAAQDHRAV